MRRDFEVKFCKKNIKDISLLLQKIPKFRKKF